MTSAILTSDQLAYARDEWIADCWWPDLDANDIPKLTDAQVIRGIARHYDGGLAGFIANYIADSS